MRFSDSIDFVSIPILREHMLAAYSIDGRRSIMEGRVRLWRVEIAVDCEYLFLAVYQGIH